MIFIFQVIGSSLFIVSLGESINMRFHRVDVPFSYDYSSMHFYDKKFKKDNINGYRHKNYYQRPQRKGNLQYAPLVFETKEEESLTKFYKKTTTASTVLLDLPEVSTTKKNVQPLFDKQYNFEYVNENGQIPKPYLSGHNIKMLPITNEFKESGFRNIGPSYKNTNANIRCDICESYSKSKLSKLSQEITSFSRNAVTDSYEFQKIFKHFHQKLKPIKYIIQATPDSENTKIQPILNPHYIKGPRLHLNMAHAFKIAHGQNKALENEHRKRIRINKLKHIVPDIDELLEQKSFLSPSSNL